MVHKPNNINSIFKKPINQESCLFNKEKSSQELNTRLIEVLEEEKDLSENINTETAVIDKKFLNEVFTKHGSAFKCEAEFTSGDDANQSEDLEEIEIQEKIFLEE